MVKILKLKWFSIIPEGVHCIFGVKLNSLALGMRFSVLGVLLVRAFAVLLADDFLTDYKTMLRLTTQRLKSLGSPNFLSWK